MARLVSLTFVLDAFAHRVVGRNAAWYGTVGDGHNHQLMETVSGLFKSEWIGTASPRPP